jgi:hypothetical protein
MEYAKLKNRVVHKKVYVGGKVAMIPMKLVGGKLQRVRFIRRNGRRQVLAVGGSMINSHHLSLPKFDLLSRRENSVPVMGSGSNSSKRTKQNKASMSILRSLSRKHY